MERMAESSSGALQSKGRAPRREAGRVRTSENTIAAAVFAAPRLNRGLPALADGGAPPITFDDALRVTDRLVAALFDGGVDREDRVAFTAPRGPLGLVGFLAISSVAVCCPLNPKLRPDELVAKFETMRITAVVDAGGDPAAGEVADRAGLPLLAVTAGTNGALDLAFSWQRARSSRAERGSPPGDAMMMLTSGTTSNPKLVVLTHAQILSAAGAIRDAFSLGENDICLNPMPLHHVHGLISAGLSSLVSGSLVICSPNFATAAFEALLEQCRPTWFTGSPAMHLALLEHFKRVNCIPKSESLRFFRSSSAPLPASAIGQLEKLFGAPLIETYGLTETASMICSNPLPPLTRKVGSVGFAFGAQIRIADDAGRDLPTGQDGEILVRGPSVIEHYGAGDSAHADSFFGDWLRTGDVGHLDAEGYLYIVGRTKELIKRGGLSVYPAEVDDALTAHPDVAEAVAFSVPHPTLGEELVAAVVPRSGSKVGARELRAHLAGRLSSYKVPAAIIVVEAIPKNETGKVLRREMPSRLEAHLQAKGERPNGDIEASLQGTWASILDRRDVGVTDNLFLLGADPLRIERVSETLRAQYKCQVSAKDLLANPSIRDQATLIAARIGGPRE